jgi:hypothetical protein
MARPPVIGGRNLLEPQAMEELGLEYYRFGRPMDNPTPVVVPARFQ